jgi:pyridoxamine 5'-phosphate oxidase
MSDGGNPTGRPAGGAGAALVRPAGTARWRDDRDETFDVTDLAGDWLEQFDRWFTEAVESGLLAEPNAMVLATATPQGVPSARTVLLKAHDRRGLTFFTNYDSRKGREIAANPVVSLVLSWPVLNRQIVVCGRVERVSREESEAYFRSRPRASQIGAAASPQSRVVASRQELDEALARVAARYPEGTEVPLPDHWGGLRVVPDTVEFWHGRTGRLHDRLRYRREADGTWAIERLAP